MFGLDYVIKTNIMIHLRTKTKQKTQVTLKQPVTQTDYPCIMGGIKCLYETHLPLAFTDGTWSSL